MADTAGTFAIMPRPKPLLLVPWGVTPTPTPTPTDASLNFTLAANSQYLPILAF